MLVNLGTPSSPSTADVRKYLKEFLSDRRVVEMPRLPWWFILNIIILNTRPKRSSSMYQKIWTDDGSPLLTISNRITEAISAQLHKQYGDSLRIELAMRYGSPSINTGLERLRQAGSERLLILPLYPQYSAATSASVFDAVTKALRQWRWIPEIRFINQYHDHPQYIAALAKSVNLHRSNTENQPGDTIILMSFHGIPRSYLESGDPYYCQCQKTARLLAEALTLSDDQYRVTFQSRLGPQDWLQPYTENTLKKLAAEGRNIDVICPGFSTDCLETLEEIAVEGRKTFLDAGGKQFNYIECLNDQPHHVDMLEKLIDQHLTGWHVECTQGDLEARMQRAHQMMDTD